MSDPTQPPLGAGARPSLTQGPVQATILRLAGPMVIGILAIMAMNVVDTYFVGQLGTVQLAAMAFTFPVVFFVGSLTLGLGVGTTSVIARAIGGGDRSQVRRLTTDSLTLALVVVAAIATPGYFAMDPLFRLLGASDESLPYILDYMSIWFYGMICVVVPMVGNSAIRATGDARTPAAIMIVAALMNIALDPIFIFGLGPVPALGIRGAAIATVISRALTLALSLYVLRIREDLITLAWPGLRGLVRSWGEILQVGLPAAATNLVVPLTAAILTRFVSAYGPASVAAFGAGTRVEGLAGIASMAVGSAMGPFMGQNWGAGLRGRVSEGIRRGEGMAFAWGVGVYVLLALLAAPVAAAFSDDPETQRGIVLYLWLALWGQAFLGIFMVVSSTFNAIGQPMKAALLSVLRTLVLSVPLAYVGSEIFGVGGIFAAIGVANLGVGILSYLWARPLRRGPEVAASQ